MPSPTMDERRELVEMITKRLLSAVRSDLDFLKLHGFGVAIFAFELEASGSIAYISTAQREGVLGAIKEWVAFQEAGLTTEARGEREKS